MPSFRTSAADTTNWASTCPPPCGSPRRLPNSRCRSDPGTELRLDASPGPTMQQCRSPDPTAPHYPHPTLPDPRGPGRAAPDPAARPAARAATLAHTAGADLKTVQDQLGHASIA